MIPISLYIHLPWCVKKCPYCDFNAHPLKGDILKEDYVHRLITDLETHKNLLEHRPLSSIFLGGGTPSLFSPQQLKPLFEAIKHYQAIDNIEITIEANPATVDMHYYAGYVELGINRISIGGQSFQSYLLTSLGRTHDPSNIHQAIKTAKSAGFKRINLDIMYGLPHQTPQESYHDLQLFLTHDLEHLSWYQLNIEANTLFAVQTPNLPTEDHIEQMEIAGKALLKQAGYQQYEISAYTKDQYCTHNVNYWEFADYIGIGCGAHSKITSDPFIITRLIKHKHPKAYMKTLIQSEQTISHDERILEFAINHFRMLKPVSLKKFETYTGINKALLTKKLSKAQDQGLVTIDPDYIYPTPNGLRFHNDLLLSLI